ncbi:early endosome antigen 1-like [Montipora foliosa]|uniref:early endosome antigen 1-like n=1 Tax=Montipora foliosa TaxID=591990 RepID=UPI0035F1B487
MSDVSSEASKDDRSDDSLSSDGEDEFYDIEVKKDVTDNVSTTSESSTSEETVKVKVEEYSANEDFRERFFEAQERLGELEAELKNTRERLRNLENACENTEEKIGVLKNAAFSYHRSFSEHEITFKTVIEENRELKITIEKLQALIRKNKQEREKSDEIKRTINEHLKDQLDAATKENEELERELDELKSKNSKDLRDIVGPHDDKKKSKYCGTDGTRGGSDLVQELESLKLRFDAIESEKNQLQKEKEELRDEVDDLEKRLKDFQQKLSADDEIIEEMKQQILEYHSQIAETENNCDSSRSKNIELEKEISVLRGLMAELESKLTDEKERREDLIYEGTQRLEIQNKKISQLEMNLRDVCKEKELLNLQFVDSKNKAEMDMKQWTKQLNESHVRAELFRKEVSDKEKKLATLRTENDELRGLKDDVASLQRQLQDAHDRELARFAEESSGDETDGDKDDELKRLKQDNEELNQEVEQLRDDVISLQSELAEFVQEKERRSPKGMDPEIVVVERFEVQSSAPLARIESDLSDYDDVNEERVVAVSETPNLVPPEETTTSWSSDDFAKSQIQELEELLEKTKAEKQKLEDCLEESEDKAKKTADELSKTIDNLTEKCEVMSQELLEKETIINRLRKDEAQDKKNIRDLEQKRLRDQEYVERELEKARQELHDLKSHAAAKEDYKEKYHELKAEYDKTVEDKEKLEGEKEEVAKERAKLQDQLEDLNKMLEKGKQMYAEVCDENDDIMKAKNKMEDEVKFLSEELKEEEELHSSEKGKLDKEIKDLKEKIGRLEEEISELKKKLRRQEDEENWRKKHDILQRDINSLQGDKKRLERSVEKIEDEHEDTKSKYSKARRELSDARTELGTLRRQVSELKLTKDTADVDKELRKTKDTLKEKEEECRRYVGQLEDLEKEMATVKVALKNKEEACERYLQELEKMKESLTQQKADDGWQEKFESLKLKLDEVEGEKNSLQKEKNNLQSELRKDSEKLAEVEIKLSQANMEKEGLSKDFHKSHTRITHLEIELQKASKQKQQAEEQAKWIKKELLTREETISRLGKELSDKNKIIASMDDNVDKDNEILMLEREIQLLQSRIPASEKDESVLHNQIHLLETNVKEVKEQLDGKTAQLEECEKKNEKLGVRVVELSKEIQSLYRRYEESCVHLAELQAGRPVVLAKAETTSLTIDVEGKPEVELGVFVQERVRSLPRVVTPGHGRSVSELEIPVSQLPGTVVIGEPVSLTVDYSARGSPVVSHPSEVTASEPEDNDEVSWSQDSEDERDIPPVVFTAQEVYSAPPPPTYSPSAPNPERILISAQALPEPQRPKSIDAERFPFLKGSDVKLNAGAFQPVPSRASDQIEDEADNERLPQRRFRAISREELFRLDGLLHAHAHHQDPPENGVDNVTKGYPEDELFVGKEDYPKEFYDQQREDWPKPPSYQLEGTEEPPIPPTEDAYTNESAPDKEFADEYDRYPDPYEKPPRKPESTYTRKIIGVYNDDGNLIGYQEVYEEKADDYMDEINGGVLPYPDPYGYEGIPKPPKIEQYPSENLPYTNDTRELLEGDFEYVYGRNGNTSKEQWYSDEPDERGFVQTKYNRENDATYRHAYSDPYGHLNGDNYGRNHPSEVARQYASGTYL